MSEDVLDSVGFHPVIKRWFKQRFAYPSPPQQRGWPSIAAAKHTLILAPTGSGKTLAAEHLAAGHQRADDHRAVAVDRVDHAGRESGSMAPGC